MQVGDELHWYHMWDYDPPPHAQISIFVYVIRSEERRVGKECLHQCRSILEIPGVGGLLKRSSHMYDNL